MKQLKRDIQTVDNNKNILINVLNNNAKDIIAETKEIIRTNIEKEIKQEIINQDENTRTIKPKLKELKQELNELLYKIPELIDGAFENEDSLFWSLKQYNTYSGQQKKDLSWSIEITIVELIIPVLNRFTELLKKYVYSIDYVYRDKNYLNHYDDFLFKKIYFGFREINKDAFLKNYVALIDCVSKLEELRNNLGKEDAADLWDNA